MGWRERFGKVLALAIGLVALPCMATPDALTDAWRPFRAVWFDNLSVTDGLPHSTVTSLVQDARGVVWMGTFGGLVRYDGSQLREFGEQPDAPDGLTDAYVRCMAALSNGNLLLGTNAGGLVEFDAATNRFHRFPVGADGTSDDKIFALASDRAQGWWIVTDGGTDHLKADGRIERMPEGPGSRPEFPARSFSALQDEAGNLWIGNDRGLFRRAAGQTAFVRVHADDPRVDAVIGDRIWSIFRDAAGRTWFGSGQSGSVYLDRQGQWHFVEGISGSESITGRRTIRAIVDTPDGDVWFASDGAGVAAWNPATGRARMLSHDASVPSTIPGNTARALMRDRSGNIWVATELGVARHDTRATGIFTVPPSPFLAFGLSDPDVHTVFVDPRGRIWLGLGTGHIDVLDLGAGTMRHVQVPGDQGQRDVQAFAVAPDGAILAGSQGIARIDPDTLQVQTGQVPLLDGEIILSMSREGDQLLAGTYDGLFSVDLGAGQAPYTAANLSNETVRDITRMDGQWWLSTINGISVWPDGEPDFFTLRHDPAQPDSLPQNYIGSMALDSNRRLWVATYGGIAWVDRWTPKGPWRFRHLGLAEGLASAKVDAVLVDRRERAWASLAHGLARVDPADFKVTNFGARDGMRVASYEHRSAAVGPHGELLFGGLGGLTVVLPDAPPAREGSEAVTVTGVLQGGEETPYGKLPGDGGSIVVDSDSRSVRVDFALLDYGVAGETRYAYRLEGFDKGWVDVARGNPAAAVYTNLPGGHSTLHLRAVTIGGASRTIDAAVTLAVTPRWYESWWARLLVVIALLGVVLALSALRTVFLRRRASVLQHEVEARTRDLQAANEQLDRLAGTDELTGAFNRRRFLDLAGRAVTDAQLQDKPLSMVLIDLDNFKVVNDTYGHLAGDAVIRAAMDLTARLCRGSDLVGRYGGEELIICLPGTDAEGAFQLTERIRQAMAERTVMDGGRSITVTASAGIAVWRRGESLNGMLRRADTALYAAKHAGRNRTEIDEG